MDQTNVFVTGLVEAADTLLIEGVREQVRNADWLRWTSIAGGAVIVLVVAGAINAFRQTTREISHARDETRAANEMLEKRVEERTSALKSALDRTELLLAEVNHRVANSLAMVASLVRLQGRASKEPSVQEALAETRDASTQSRPCISASTNPAMSAWSHWTSTCLDCWRVSPRPCARKAMAVR